MTAPIKVGRAPWWDGWWSWACTACECLNVFDTHAEALGAALAHVTAKHGCPQHAITGERCDSACIHCGGRQRVTA